MDRIRALGNSVSPAVSEYVGRLIVEHAQERAA
jgi:site-specific DNA-cytosine methylase